MAFDLDTVKLAEGAHEWRGDPSAQTGCAMEWASFLAGEPWTDRPACVSSVLGSFVRRWNDDLHDDERQLLKPFLARFPGTADPAADERRSWQVADWIVRTHTPAWLRVAGLDEEAAALSGLPALQGPGDWEGPEAVVAKVAAETPNWKAQVRVEARALLSAVGAASRADPSTVREADRDYSWAAVWDAARDVAWETAVRAARPAARGSVGLVAWNPGLDGALDTAWDCMRHVAWTAASSGGADRARAGDREGAGRAARAAAHAALDPTAVELRDSAFALLGRLLDDHPSSSA